MAVIKYAGDIAPLIGEHSGFTFQSSDRANVMFRGQANDRSRYSCQVQRKMNITAATTHWRNMSATARAAWSLFAAAVPQYDFRSGSVQLSAYQCFLKRQSYIFLNHGISSDFMESPELFEFPDPYLFFSISPSVYQIDASDLFVARFGVLPKVGDSLLIDTITLVKTNGQVFSRYRQRLDVTALDAGRLVISIFSAEDLFPYEICFYLSKTQNQGREYSRSFQRYVGWWGMPFPFYPIQFGYLYSPSCFFDSVNLYASGWHGLPLTFFHMWVQSLGGSFEAQQHMKDTISGFWDSSIALGDNSSLFSGRAPGFISESGLTTDFGFKLYVSGSIFLNDPTSFEYAAINSDEFAAAGGLPLSQKVGMSARACKLDEGEEFYTGNDGKQYPLIRHAGYVITAVNLAESMLSDGSLIAQAFSPSEWLSGSAQIFASPNYSQYLI